MLGRSFPFNKFSTLIFIVSMALDTQVKPRIHYCFHRFHVIYLFFFEMLLSLSQFCRFSLSSCFPVSYSWLVRTTTPHLVATLYLSFSRENSHLGCSWMLITKHSPNSLPCIEGKFVQVVHASGLSFDFFYLTPSPNPRPPKKNHIERWAQNPKHPSDVNPSR